MPSHTPCINIQRSGVLEKEGDEEARWTPTDAGENFHLATRNTRQITLSAGESGVLGVTCIAGVMECMGDGEAEPGGAGARRGLPKAGPAFCAPSPPKPCILTREA